MIIVRLGRRSILESYNIIEMIIFMIVNDFEIKKPASFEAGFLFY